ncbi:MAG: hypothetical protein HY735_09445 [Verrucomicrobia bacterium]|nr:hypothetical protein [Verrucomicrobiota bacterium]
MYLSLDPERIFQTTRALCDRTAEMFPESGLSKVGEELLSVARQAAETSAWLGKPLLWVRVGVVLCIGLMVGLVFASLFAVKTEATLFSSVSDFLQGLESATNEMVLLGFAIFFLASLETRIKRARALKSIHMLRSLAHIIDLHQLAKDPERPSRSDVERASAPQRKLTPFQLTCYLDYCSEMLAIISKIAALYVQNFNDSVTLAAVNEVEDLSQGLSRKIWQKIMILDRVMSAEKLRIVP